MDTAQLITWFNRELTKLLECDVGEEYCRNILQMSKESEMIPFLESLLDMSVPQNKQFYNELLQRLNAPAVDKDVKVYRKPNIEEVSPKKRNQRAVKKDENNEELIDIGGVALSKQKKQSVNLYGIDGVSALDSKLSGRHSCECQAGKHKLVGNCLKCGRIVCEQEGSGPCYFCGNLVCTKEEMEKINSGSRKGEKLKADLLSKTWQGFDAIVNQLNKVTVNTHDNASLQKAIEHKNKLIEFDRNCTKRTQVIDDESDYFQSNSKWVNKEQREKLRQKQQELDEKRFGSRLGAQQYTFDIGGKTIAQERENINYDQLSHDIENILNDENSNSIEKSLQKLINNRNFPATSDVVNPDIEIDAPKFVEEPKKFDKKQLLKESNQEKPSKRNIRIQDKELQEMKDDGMCLSMHQPWASLLVHGIKIHEGRTWYTPYRGRLWIHAASKQSTDEEIHDVEKFYKDYYNGKKIDLPTSYPTSCLLGYVDLVYCLPEESYKEKFPNGESGSPFVFICENPCELLVKFPMSGQHKIFKLDRNVHFGAKKTAVIDRNN